MQKLIGYTFAAVVLAGTMVGCKNPADDMVVRENPAPLHGYRVILDATQAPGQPVDPSMSVSFEVPPAEELCMIRSRGWAEYRIPWKYIDIPVKEVSPGRFEGVMYLDWVLDENYFGLGTCRWRMNTISAGFAGKGGMGFGIGMGYNTLAPNARSTAYYYVEQFDEDSTTNTFGGATQVPTDMHKDNLDYVSDTSKFFPIYLTVEPLTSEGLTPERELERRIEQAQTTAEPKPKAP